MIAASHAVPEGKAGIPFLPGLAGGRSGDDDLCASIICHHPPVLFAVTMDRVETERGDLLQAAEEHVRLVSGSGERDAEPPGSVPKNG